jgi:hypothetical protein
MTDWIDRGNAALCCSVALTIDGDQKPLDLICTNKDWRTWAWVWAWARCCRGWETVTVTVTVDRGSWIVDRDGTTEMGSNRLLDCVR